MYSNMGDYYGKKYYRRFINFETMNIKLNFSELAGIYDMDSHTVAKYWREGGIKNGT